jgi:hypothetical protein
MLNQKRIYIKAKEYLATKENWTQDNYAIDSKGQPIGFLSDDACAFCLSGALNRAANYYNDREEFTLLRATIYQETKNDHKSIPGFNDSHTYEDVIAVLDKAIELSEGAHDDNA